MKIFLLPAITPSIPQVKSPDACLSVPQYLSDITHSICQSLTQSLKHTPFITVHKLTGPMDQLLASLKQVTPNTPPSTNCLIAVGLNASTYDGHYHSSHGWSVCNKVCNKVSGQLAQSLANAALHTLGPSAISSPGQIPSQRYLCWAGLLSDLPIPAVLTLNLYQDNRQDIAYLLSSAGRQAIIDLHTKGITDYLNISQKTEHPSSTPSSQCRQKHNHPAGSPDT